MRVWSGLLGNRLFRLYLLGYSFLCNSSTDKRKVVVAMSADHLGHKYLGGHAMTASTNLFKSATSANKNKNRAIETTSDLCSVELMFDGAFHFLRRS
jgi:hypothetical protein